MNKDIKELLDHVKGEVKVLKSQEEISNIRVKNVVENLRSILEYSAQEINYRLKQPKARDVTFPYGKNEENFNRSIKRSLKALANDLPDVYKLIEEMQPHVSQDDWLPLLCLASNTAKHNKALTLKKIVEKKKSQTIRFGNAIVIEGDTSNLNAVIKGNTYNGMPMTDLVIKDGHLNVTKKGIVDIDIDFKIIENKYIEISDIQHDCIKFLTKCIINIENYIERLENLLKNNQ